MEAGLEVPIQLSEVRITVQNPPGNDTEDPVDGFCQAVRKVIGDEQQRGPIVSFDYVSLSSPRFVHVFHYIVYLSLSYDLPTFSAVDTISS